MPVSGCVPVQVGEKPRGQPHEKQVEFSSVLVLSLLHVPCAAELKGCKDDPTMGPAVGTYP